VLRGTEDHLAPDEVSAVHLFDHLWIGRDSRIIEEADRFCERGAAGLLPGFRFGAHGRSKRKTGCARGSRVQLTGRLQLGQV